jgi:hypothetical protein
MFDKLTSPVTTLLAVAAFVLSGCANLQLGLNPLPNVYKDAKGQHEVALVTLGAFNAAQEAYVTTCGPVAEQARVATPETTSPDLAGKIDACIALGTAADTLEPAVSASGLLWSEYVDIDARIREAGPKAPADWIALAASTYARAQAAYGPIKADVDAFVAKTKELN